jgi:ribosomal protein S18 acetylase RimI-like enzyme
MNDLDFLVQVDIKDEGVDAGYRDDWVETDFASHREMVRGFVADDDKGAYVLETDSGELVGVGMWRFRNIDTEELPADSIFLALPRSLYPPDGAFCEIFQLWVNGNYRRRGLGTQIKLIAEADAKNRMVGMIYTHTEEANEHVVALNLKLGYHAVRCGPIWDDIRRVSLVKTLG